MLKIDRQKSELFLFGLSMLWPLRTTRTNDIRSRGYTAVNGDGLASRPHFTVVTQRRFDTV